MLRLLSQARNTGVREDLDSVVPNNSSLLSTGIPRKTCMAQWMNIAGAHALAHVEPGRHIHLAVGGRTLCQECWYLISFEGRHGLGRPPRLFTRFHFCCSDQAALRQDL